MRGLYSAMWRMAMPLVLGRLLWRSIREPGYRKHMGERFAMYDGRAPGWHTIWVHAVSVGETRAAEPLIDALMRAYPNSRILLTHMTPTGRETGKALFAKHGERLLQCYLPYDTPAMVMRFLRQFTPRICILMETEVWPNLVACCNERRIPVTLVNARLSARSLRRGQRFGQLMMEAARGISLVAAQTDADAERVRLLGAPKVAVTGSIKFDVVVPQAALDTGAWLRECIGQRQVLLCASTRDGEEELILDAWKALPVRPSVLLAIVPRHPQRFDDVVAMATARGLRVRRRTEIEQQGLKSDIDVLLGDSMGEMFAYYAACDVAFIGGSLMPLGGQNLIEACALGKPVLIGPHTFNFLQVSEEAIAAGGALCVHGAGALLTEAMRLLDDETECSAMGARALAFANQHRGATERTLALLKPLIY
jgi:3-deoxy-D-manno-octulosonic-acid transferase